MSGNGGMRVKITYSTTADDDYRRAIAWSNDGEETDGTRLATRKEIKEQLLSLLCTDDAVVEHYQMAMDGRWRPPM